MNEVKHIHLGRQSFTISVDAHKELRAYLAAITAEMGEKASDVVEEVELRMAELLTEHGITSEKVILPKDIKFLKEQLGEPRDFKDEDGEQVDAKTAARTEPGKRLFRDTDNAMIGGVAAGLAAYFGIDAVIVRLIFILLTFFGGGGIILYLLLFLVIPPAETSSERLQMRGKAVTVNSLKAAVDRADLSGTAQRTGSTMYKLFSVACKLALGAAGVSLALMAAMGLITVGIAAIYLAVYHPTSPGAVAFPVGIKESVALIAAGAALTIILLLAMLAGVAMVRRKWQLPGWSLATLFGLFILCVSVAGALAFRVEPKIRDRLDAMHHTELRTLSPYKNLDLNGRNTDFSFVPDTTYSITAQYTGNYDPALVKTTVDGDTLRVDTGALESQAAYCSGICLYQPSVHVTVHAPAAEHVQLSGTNATFSSQRPLNQTTMTVTAEEATQISLAYVHPAQTILSLPQNGSGSVTLNGLQAQAVASDQINFGHGAAMVTRTDELDLNTDTACAPGEAIVWLDTAGGVAKVNGKAIALKISANDVSPRGPNDIPIPTSDYCVGLGSLPEPVGRVNYDY